jgi:hypothetical protein
VAVAHYLQVRDTGFDRAAKTGADALQNRVQHTSARASDNPQVTKEAPTFAGVSAGFPSFEVISEYPRQESNEVPQAPFQTRTCATPTFRALHKPVQNRAR